MKHIIKPFVDYTWWLKPFDTQRNKPFNQNLKMSQKLLGQRIIKRYYKTLGTSVINSPMSPPSLVLVTLYYSKGNNFIIIIIWLAEACRLNLILDNKVGQHTDSGLTRISKLTKKEYRFYKFSISLHFP